ncbi:MAG: SWIM zinc finger family protein [Anaeromyxobacter sp.]
MKIAPVPGPRWTAICRDCAGAIDSVVELLQGRFSTGVMERISRQDTGLFPAPGQIELSCSCPDWADLCKHVAAVLYGIGARLDHEPELLFRLRGVDEKDLLATAGGSASLSKAAPAQAKVLASDQLSELFGIELAAPFQEKGVREDGRPSRRSRRPTAKAARPAVKPKGEGHQRPRRPLARAARKARR